MRGAHGLTLGLHPCRSIRSDDPELRAWVSTACAGDWGDDSSGQRAAAAGMGAVAAEINASMFFALGDNFYHSANSHCKQSGICPDNADGVDGAQRFKTTFEDVYTAPSLRRIPFCALHCRVLPAVRVCRWPQPVSRLRCLPRAVCLGLTSPRAHALHHYSGGETSN